MSIPKKRIKEMSEAYDRDRDYHIQIYGYITPLKSGEFRFDCYAMKKTKRRGMEVTEVNRAWSDRDYYLCKNLWRGFMGATQVCFTERIQHRQEEAMWYNDHWGPKIMWTKDDTWFIKYVWIMNPDALQHTKYKYCARDRYHGPLSLMKYIYLYRKYPQIENLVKAGLSNFVVEPFLDRMAKNKGLRDFFRSNVKMLMEDKHGIYAPMDIIRARTNGWTVAKAHFINEANRMLHLAPKGLDRVALWKYLTDNNISRWDYYHYCKAVAEAKMSIFDYGMAMPRDFYKKEKEVQKKIRIAKRREDREREKDLKRIAERVNRLMTKIRNQLAWRVGDYEVIIPTTRKEFSAEGKKMKNCVGQYFDLCADGASALFFIHRKGKPYCDVEMGRNDGSIRQCRLFKNADAPADTKKLATVLAKKLLPAFRKRKEAA